MLSATRALVRSGTDVECIGSVSQTLPQPFRRALDGAPSFQLGVGLNESMFPQFLGKLQPKAMEFLKILAKKEQEFKKIKKAKMGTASLKKSNICDS